MDSDFKGKTIGLYLHIPFCLSKCSYCDFFSVTSKSRVPDSYVNALCNEIKERFCGLGTFVDSVYVGGGTPSLLSDNQFSQIFNTIKSYFTLSSDCEITVEVNPDDVTKELLETLHKNGVNRLSCGIQSLNDMSLSFCLRRANARVCEEALNLIKNNWNGQVSVDIICGLPQESQQSFVNGLEKLLSYKPDHISMYSLTIEEETPLEVQISNGDFIYDYDSADSLWLLGRDFLEKAGYKQYEVSNFCLPKKECRHNLKYWSYQDYAGLGAGATGTVYKSGGLPLRKTNYSDIDLYTKYWTSLSDNKEYLQLPYFYEEINLKAAEFEFFMMSLRKLSGFNKSQYESLFQHKIPASFLNLINTWKEQGMAEIVSMNDDTIYTLGKKGIMFLNSFLTELL